MSDDVPDIPQDVDAEQAVLGAMILKPDLIGELGINPEDFFRPVHATIAMILNRMFTQGLVIDALTLGTELTEAGEVTRIGGLPYIHTLISMVPTPEHGYRYAQIVRDKAVRRQIRQVGIALQQLAFSEAESVDDLVLVAHDKMNALERGSGDQTGPILAQDLMDSTMMLVERTQSGTEIGLRSPWADLNDLLNPFRPGQLIVIGARPAIGKSTVAMDICRQSALRDGAPTVFVSLEMSRDEITMRMMAAEGRIPLNHLVKGTMVDDDWAKMTKAVNSIGDNPLLVDDTPGQTIGSIRSMMRRQSAKHQLGVVAIDYLQLVTTSQSRNSNREQGVAEVSRGLKLLAREFRCTVIAMSQLNRGLENRSDKRPGLSDLRESGAIENDADTVLLLHREDVYDSMSPRAGEMDIIIAKQRNGPTGIATVAFQGHFARTVDMARPWTDR